MVEAGDFLRGLAGSTGVLGRVDETRFALALLDTASEPVESAWSRIHSAAAQRHIGIGAAIFEPDHVNSILMAGRADLCALARPHLADPYWTLHAAAQLGYRGAPWPKQYLGGRDQLERNLLRARQLAAEQPEANG